MVICLPVIFGQGDNLSNQSELSSKSPGKVIYPNQHPVWVINIEGELHSLTKPITLRLSCEGKRFYAENDSLEVCGYGDTRDEALQDAIGDIAYYYSYYGALKDDDVTGHGCEIKKRYEGLFD